MSTKEEPEIDDPCSLTTEPHEHVSMQDSSQNVESPGTSKLKPFHVDSAKIKSVPLSEQAPELKELGLFSVYNQTELEQGIIQQVDSAINAEQEKQAKKHAEKELNSVLNEIRSTKEEINHIDKAMRSIVLPSGNSYGNKDAHRTLISIKSQKEIKNKQLKKLRSRHRYLLATLSGTPEGLEEDSSQNEEQDQEEESFNILRGLLTGDGQSKTAPKETEEERLIRLGEMTPFGTTLQQTTPQPSEPPPLTDFEKYMMEQVELASKKKSLHGRKKGVKRKGNNNNNTQKEIIKKKLKNDINEDRRLEKMKEKEDVGSDPLSSEEELMPTKEQYYSGSTFKREAKSSKEMRPNWQSDSEMSDFGSSDYSPDPEDWQSSDNDAYSNYKYFEKSKKKKTPVFARKLKSAGDTKRKLKTSKKSEKKRTYKTRDDGDKAVFYKRLKENKLAKLREKQARIEQGESDNDSDEGHASFEGGWKLPQRIWKKLYRYQQTGVKWLWELHQQECGGIVGDEMGLGKTIQIITFLAGLKYSKLYNKNLSYNGLGPVIIICPTTVMHQWLKEFHTWWPEFRVAILHDSGSFQGSKASLVQDIVKTHSILVTSYSGARLNKDILLRHKWHYVVLDEGHKIRNPNAEVTVVCKQFRTCHRLILSGSPVQNNLKELWSLIDFVFPGKLGTLPDFMVQFSVPITMGGYSNATAVQVQTAYKCACVLRDTINPYLLRRMKEDVKKSMQLPEKNEQVLFCRLTAEQRSTYEEYLKSKECQMILSRDYQVFAGLITLRKICNHPDLSTGGPRDPLEEGESSDESNQYGYWKRSGKMIVIESLLKIWKEQNHKVLLFSQSRQMLDIIEYFVKHKYSYMRMDGSTGISSRQPAINKFNNDPSIFLFLLTTRVGGLGVNLTSANRVVIFDPDWNPSTDIQARERAWRIGQNRQVTIYRLLTTGTIEEKIYHRQIFKQFLTNRVLKDPKQRRFFKSNDLFELFSLGSEDSVHGNETNALFAGTGANIDSKAPTKTLSTQPRPVKRESVLKKTFKKFKPQTTTSKKTSKPLDINIPSEGTQTEESKTDHVISSNKLVDSNVKNDPPKSDVGSNDSSDVTCNIKKADEPDGSMNNEETDKNAADTNISYDNKDKLKDRVTVQQNNENSTLGAPSNEQEDKGGDNKEDKHSPCSSPSNKPQNKETVHQNEENSPYKPEDITEWKAKEMKKIEKLKKKLLKLQSETKKNKKLEKKKKKKVKNASLEGKKIAYLSRHSVYQHANNTEDSSKLDDYVLQKLFKKNGVQSAMKHDVIMDSANPDYVLVEKEAERVAKEAALALKRSRRRCMPASSGIPTWTGSVGVARPEKPRFGLKKNSKVASPLKKQEVKPKFGSKKLFNGALSGHSFTKTSKTDDALPTSSELLSNMRARNNITDDNAVGTVQLNDKAALLQDLHAFISFQASTDGQATTSEIVEKFKDRIPTEDSAVFRSLLHEICDFLKLPNGHAVWRLRQSFR